MSESEETPQQDQGLNLDLYYSFNYMIQKSLAIKCGKQLTEEVKPRLTNKDHEAYSNCMERYARMFTGLLNVVAKPFPLEVDPEPVEAEGEEE